MKVIFKSIQVIDHIKTGEQGRLTREARRKSLRSVATRMGISATFLSDLERGRRGWTQDLANKFSKAIISA